MSTRQFIIGGLGSGGGGGVLVSRAGTENIPDATQYFQVFFSTSLPNTNYALNVNITNTAVAVSLDPIYLSIVNVDKRVDGFDVLFNAPTDSADYQLEYQATAHN